jgi:hypothetical protein
MRQRTGATRLVPGVGPRHRPQMSFAVDQQPVRALRPDGPHPAFGVTVRTRRPAGILTIRTPTLAKTASNALVNLASRSRTRNRSEPIRSARVCNQVASLLRDPGNVWIPGHPENMHPPGRLWGARTASMSPDVQFPESSGGLHATRPCSWISPQDFMAWCPAPSPSPAYPVSSERQAE